MWWWTNLILDFIFKFEIDLFDFNLISNLYYDNHELEALLKGSLNPILLKLICLTSESVIMNHYFKKHLDELYFQSFLCRFPL